jgi:hypothetical protein
VPPRRLQTNERSPESNTRRNVTGPTYAYWNTGVRVTFQEEPWPSR